MGFIGWAAFFLRESGSFPFARPDWRFSIWCLLPFNFIYGFLIDVLFFTRGSSLVKQWGPLFWSWILTSTPTSSLLITCNPYLAGSRFLAELVAGFTKHVQKLTNPMARVERLIDCNSDPELVHLKSVIESVMRDNWNLLDKAQRASVRGKRNGLDLIQRLSLK